MCGKEFNASSHVLLQKVKMLYKDGRVGQIGFKCLTLYTVLAVNMKVMKKSALLAASQD